MEGRRRKRFPSEEELELWDRVTRHDEPLTRRLSVARRHPAVKMAQPVPAAVKEQPAKDGPALKPEGKRTVNAKSRPAEPPPPQPFDHRAAKRIARGRREIDARLDLHGLRQHDAYVALRRFLAHCQAEGHRHVLIITGKGSSPESEASRDFWTSDERGVLRRLVPHWLCEPAMRLHVVSFTESTLKHGGSGALYVTIRKGPRTKI